MLGKGAEKWQVRYLVVASILWRKKLLKKNLKSLKDP